MNISITGTLGSGKSSVCKLLEQSGYEIISNGVLFRNIAAEKGVTVVELNKMAKTDQSIDKMLDDRSTQLGKEKDHAVFDARMGWHFVPDSFKVFLMVDVNEAANRVYNDNRVSESYETVTQAKNDLMKRQLLEKERYTSLYGVNYLDLSNYNLVIESTSATPEEIASRILLEAKKYSEKKMGNMLLLNPTSLYPGKSVEDERELGHAAEQIEQVHVSLKGNNFYVVEGQSILLEEIKEDKHFIEVTYSDCDLIAPKQEELTAFEQTGGFRYKYSPELEDEAYLSYGK